MPRAPPRPATTAARSSTARRLRRQKRPNAPPHTLGVHGTDADQRPRHSVQRREQVRVVLAGDREPADDEAEDERAEERADEGADDPAPEAVREEDREVPDG